MKNIHIENQGSKTYLVYAVQPNDVIDSLSLGMITNNSISGLAPTLFTQMNMTQYIKYDITAKLAVKQLFMGTVNRKRLVGVFSGIVNALLSAEDYMIDANNIVLNLDYIFADVSSCETVLICLPIVDDSNQTVDLGVFFKNIIFNIRPDQTENCDYIAKIINYLNGNPVFSLIDFKKVLDEIKREDNGMNIPGRSVPSKQETVREEEPPQPVIPSYVQQYMQQNVQHVQQPVQTQTVQPQQIQQQPVQQQVVSQQPVQPPVNKVVTPPAEQKQKKKKKQEVVLPEENFLGPDEKPISLIYLLQHYNKENVAKYKAQKEAKKGQTVSGTPQNTPAPKEQARQQNQNSSFAIPNQQSVSFAIPNQPNTSFAVPNQQTPQAIPQNQPQAKYQNTQQEQPKVHQQAYVSHVQPVSQGYESQNSYTEVPNNFGYTTVLGGNSEGKTAVLSDMPAGGEAPSVKKPYIIRVRNNERIPVSKEFFRIGTEKNYVDYYIGDNSYISRGHASLVSKDGRFFIIDNNSRNHTYVNGSLITSSTEFELKSGDTFKLANEEFEFKLF